MIRANVKFNKPLTKHKSEWTPDQIKYPRHFPYQNDHQEAGKYFCSYNRALLVMFAEDTKGSIHHESEKSMHGAYVV